MNARRLSILLFWAILASILWFNIVLVLEVASLEEESNARELFSIRGGASYSPPIKENQSDDDDHEANDDEDDDDDDDGDYSPSNDNEEEDDETPTDDDEESINGYNSNQRQPLWLFMAKKRTRQRHVIAELPENFTSPVADIATACASKNPDTGVCSITPCHNNTTTAPHFTDGALLRDNNIRGTPMILSGKARAGSGCAVSRKHKFIYIHVLKSGGMTLKAFFKKALCDGSTEMPCQNGRDMLDIVDCRAALQQYPDFFVFSFVRNPYARLYSGYSMATLYGNEDAQQEQHSSQISFEQFALRPRIRDSMSPVSASHYVPQSVFLMDRHECPVYDFVGRLEHLEEDLLQVLHLIGAPELLQAFQKGMLQHEQSTAYGSRMHQDLQQAYANDQVKKAVMHEYARDFESFGYDKMTVPSK